MIVISNSSPLIALGRLQLIDIFKHLFEKIFIPDFVYKETVLDSRIDTQKQAIVKAIGQGLIEIIKPKTDLLFKRKLDEAIPRQYLKLRRKED